MFHASLQDSLYPYTSWALAERKTPKKKSDELWRKLFGSEPGAEADGVNTKIARLLIEQVDEDWR